MDKKHTKPADWGRAPWRYVMVGDSDGEQWGYDHMVYDADGEELTNAPNERVGVLMAAAPQLLAACRLALPHLTGSDADVIRFAIETATAE